MLRFAILFALIMLKAPSAWAGGPTDQALLDTVRGFYGWALEQGKETVLLEPRIMAVTGTNRLYLDLASLDSFTTGFLGSGYFAPEFAQTLAGYYRKHQAEIAALPQSEFDEMEQDGRGLLLETEDMDLFFCAQEYEYSKQFVQGIRLKSAWVEGATAAAVVISPAKWETTFHFVKVQDRWLISGYCVFR
jgi:hypothetical protein